MIMAEWGEELDKRIICHAINQVTDRTATRGELILLNWFTNSANVWNMIRDINLHAFNMTREIRNRDRRRITGKLDPAIRDKYDT